MHRPRCPQLLPLWLGGEPGGSGVPSAVPGGWIPAEGMRHVGCCPAAVRACASARATREAAASPRHQVHGRVEPWVCGSWPLSFAVRWPKPWSWWVRGSSATQEMFLGEKRGDAEGRGLGVSACCLPEAAGASLPAGGVCCGNKRGCSGASPSLLFPSSVIPRHWAACKFTPSKACLWGRNVAQGDRKSLALVFTHPQTPSALTSQENPLAGQGNPLRKWKRSVCAWKITKERGKLARARHFPEACCRQVQLTRDGVRAAAIPPLQAEHRPLCCLSPSQEQSWKPTREKTPGTFGRAAQGPRAASDVPNRSRGAGTEDTAPVHVPCPPQQRKPLDPVNPLSHPVPRDSPEWCHMGRGMRAGTCKQGLGWARLWHTGLQHYGDGLGAFP